MNRPSAIAARSRATAGRAAGLPRHSGPAAVAAATDPLDSHRTSNRASAGAHRCATLIILAKRAARARGALRMEKQQELAARFRALHESGVFVIPNVWDGASTAIMARLGFKALATSSGACAATLGKLDGEVTRVEALLHARLIVSV